TAVADGLNLRAAKALCSQALAKPVDVGGLGEFDVHISAALKVDAVVHTALLPNGKPACEEKNGAQGIEILGLAHPIDVGLFKELDHPLFLPFLRLQALTV